MFGRSNDSHLQCFRFSRWRGLHRVVLVLVQRFNGHHALVLALKFALVRASGARSMVTVLDLRADFFRTIRLRDQAAGVTIRAELLVQKFVDRRIKCHIVDGSGDEGGHTTQLAITIKSFIKEYVIYT